MRIEVFQRSRLQSRFSHSETVEKKNRTYNKTWKNIYRAESIYGLTNIYRKEIKNNYRDINNCINLKDSDKSIDCNHHTDFKNLEFSF